MLTEIDDNVETQEMFIMPRIGRQVTLDVIAQLAEEWGSLTHLGLKLRLGTDGWNRFMLPAARGSAAKKSKRFHDSLISALQLAGGISDIGRAAGQSTAISLDNLYGMEEAAVLLTADSGASTPSSAEIPEEMLAVFPEPASAGPLAAAVLRQGRHVKILNQGTQFLAAYLCDAAQDYGSVSDLLGRADLPEEFTVLRRWSAGSCVLWLPLDHSAPSGPALDALGRALSAWEEDGIRDRGLLKPRADQRVILQISPPENAIPVADPVEAADAPAQTLDFRVVTLKPEPDAARSLTRTILDQGHRIGYRLRLGGVPSRVAEGMDLEPLLEEIEDLKLRIAQITALGAPQMKLMRFSDAQLPALVDALRRLPPETLHNGALKYAAGHSAGRSEPAHYLLYDPSVTPLRLPEILWQTQTEKRPISYWLEPFVAEAQMQQPTETRIFVPENQVLTPSLAHFGGDVDGALKLVLGNLFHDLGALARDPARQPWFIFTPLLSSRGQMEVEALDGASFAPVTQQIGWINDYLQVRGPNVIEQDKLRALAEELYEGAYVQAVSQEMAQNMTAAETAWDNALEQLRKQAVQLLDDHSREVADVANRLVKAQTYLQAAGQEMAALERLTESAEAALRGRNTLGRILEEKDAEIQAAGQTFTEQMARQVKLGEARISRSLNSMEALRSRLDQVLGARR